DIRGMPGSARARGGARGGRGAGLGAVVVSHLHIPDGVLPPILWGPGLALAAALLLLAVRATRLESPRTIAYQGALGGLMLAVMLSPGTPVGIGRGGVRIGLFAGVTIALWLVAIAAESAVAFGVGRFLARVRPDLLPAAPTRAPAVPAAGVP